MSFREMVPVRPFEIDLDNRRWPILGAVRRKSVTPFPPKVVSGDYSRADRVIESEHIWSDWSGGIGIEEARPNRDDDRYHYGTLNGQYRGLILPPYPGIVTKPHADAIFLCGTYGRSGLNGSAPTAMWFVRDPASGQDKGMQIYSYEGGVWYPHETRFTYGGPPTGTFHRFSLQGYAADYVAYYTPPLSGSSDKSVARSSSLLQYGDRMYAASSSPIYLCSFSYGTGGGTPTWYGYSGPTPGTPQSAISLCAFDGKIFSLESSGYVYWMDVNSITFDYYYDTYTTTWVTAGRVPGPPGSATKLFVYVDQSSAPALYATTDTGLCVYDQDTSKWYTSPVQVPYSSVLVTGMTGYAHHARSFPATVWQGSTYAGYEMGMYKFNGDVLQSVGPDKDQGLPQEYRGSIECLEDGFGQLYYSTHGKPDGAWSSSYKSAVLATTGQSSSMLFETNTGGVISLAVGVIPGQMFAQLDTSKVCYSFVVPKTLHNPLTDPAFPFATSGYLIGAWTSLGWESIDKLGLSLSAVVDNWQVDPGSPDGSGLAPITIYLDLENEEGNVTTLTLESKYKGETRISLGTGGDFPRFRRARLRVNINRNTNPSYNSYSPVLKSVTLGYLRVPNALEGYEVQVDLTEARCRSQYGRSSQDMIEDLIALKRDKRPLTFYYAADGTGETSPKTVWIHEIIGSVEAGDQGEGGRFGVLLLELDT